MQQAFDFDSKAPIRITAGAHGTTRQAPRRDGYAPVNLVTGQAYTGGNVDTLKMWHVRNGFGTDYRYATLKQANEAGLKVKKGSHGCVLQRALDYSVKTLDAGGNVTEESRKGVRKFVVFHVSQLEPKAE